MLLLKNIIKKYKIGDETIYALNDVSFEIKDGEFLAIMGSSGSGKSTLMHILGCLDSPTSGQYFINDQDVSKLDADNLSEIRRSKIGFVFQAFNLLPRITVLQNVMLPLVYSGIDKVLREQIAKDSLLKAGFPIEKFNNKSNQISGGQIQRVAIARSLVNNPKIVLADEPTGNLDTKTSEVVMQTFKKLNQQHGVTIVLITHEEDISKYAKRIINLKDGKVISDTININQR